MLGDASSTTRVASALYALGEIAQFHRSRDIIYFSTNAGFLRIIQLLPMFVLSPDPMIRRQTFIAARKANQQKVIDEIWQKIENAQSEGLKAEAQEHLIAQPSGHANVKLSA